jgi:hypothetical protein
VTGTLRWAALNNLYLDFFWMALQAVEKHLKAILLFNGKRAVSHRHEHRPDHAMILRNAILWSHATSPICCELATNRLTARMGSPLRSLRGQEFV